MQELNTVKECVRTLLETVSEEMEEGGYEAAERLLSDFVRALVDAGQLDGQRGSRSSVLEVIKMADKLMKRNSVMEQLELTTADLVAEAEEMGEIVWGDFIRDAEMVELDAPEPVRPTPILHSHEEPVPEPEQLAEWMSNGGCEATDGCWVEPDGKCEHGKQSWMLELGLI